MKNYPFKNLLNIFLCMLLSAGSSVWAENMTLVDKKGRTMEVELLRRQGEKVAVKRLKDGKEFLIKPSSLNAKSAKQLKQKAGKLKLAYPPLEIGVVVGKRRKSDGYYMKKMTITAKVEVTNKDHKIPCPPCQGNIVFIGQDQRDTEEFQVLSNQEFEIIPTARGVTFESEAFITRYDSDNKGSGNVGGYKYVGYLVVLRDKGGKVLATKTVYSLIKKVLEFNAGYPNQVITYPEGTYLDKNLVKVESRRSNWSR